MDNLPPLIMQKRKKKEPMDVILTPPAYIKKAVEQSIRDLEFERDELLIMHPEVLPLTWPPNNWTKVHILKVLEYWANCMRNNEFACLINTLLVHVL